VISNLPAGLLIARRLRVVLVVAPWMLLAGVLCVGMGQPFGLLVAGRALMGIGHALGMIGGLTAILRVYAGRASALNVYEFAAMIGMVGGVMVVGALPAGLPWNRAFLITSLPLLMGIALLPLLVQALPADTGRAPAPPADTAAPLVAPAGGRGRVLVALAFLAGGAVSLGWSTIEQFVIPLRASREFGLGRSGVARLLMIAQLADLAALMPVGMVADRTRTTRVLGLMLLVFAMGIGLVAFGDLPVVTVGCVLFGFGMAGWMLPLSVWRRETAPERIPWRMALYRLGVDGGIFLGPFLSGLLGEARIAVLPAVLVVVLAATSVLLLTARR
jgi:MFS family permease